MITMILTILLIGIAVLILNYNKHGFNYSPGEWIEGSFWVGVIGMFIGVLMVCVVSKSSKIEEQFRTYLPIISLDDGKSLEGSFALGTGTINDVSYYIMYAQDESGRIFQTRRKTRASYIIETEEYINKGQLERVIYDKSCVPLWCFPEQTSEYNIYVPKGTIVRNFQLGN